MELEILEKHDGLEHKVKPLMLKTKAKDYDEEDYGDEES